MLMPLPSFSWANGAEVWNCMLEKDAAYSKLRNHRMLDRHPSLVDSYRTILFDWLSEVSQECKFHRETYHLALDFIDRYLAAQANVGKLQLQLIGTTCLFLAAKFEEIRPPSVIVFAELTDGACQPEDILDNEVVVLSAINWEITPMTPNSWLNIYMQIMLNLENEDEQQTRKSNSYCSTSPLPTTANSNNSSGTGSMLLSNDENDSGNRDTNLSNATKTNPSNNDSFILPANNGILKSNHKRIASVIDLALLHIESLRFSNSILTASALHYFTDASTLYQCTGYKQQELADCIRWLKPFAETILEIREPVFIATCKGETNSTQMHSHIATAKLLDKAMLKMAIAAAADIKVEEISRKSALKRKMYTILAEEEATDSEADSLLSPTKPTTLLTPPRSVRKSRRVR